MIKQTFQSSSLTVFCPHQKSILITQDLLLIKTSTDQLPELIMEYQLSILWLQKYGKTFLLISSTYLTTAWRKTTKFTYSIIRPRMFYIYLSCLFTQTGKSRKNYCLSILLHYICRSVYKLYRYIRQCHAYLFFPFFFFSPCSLSNACM